MLTRSPQCVHSTGPWTAGLYPGAVPKCGLSASGERPRQPLMHSVDPGVGMYGISAAYGFARVAESFRPSSSDRFTHVRHIETPPDKLNSAFRFHARMSAADVWEYGERTMIEYMNRLITPRSQRTTIGTVRPSIVVVCRIEDAGGGAAGS